MPNIKSAKKRMELSREAGRRNRAARSELRTTLRRVRESTDPDAAEELRRHAVSLVDRAASRNLIHANRAARIKRQLQTHVAGLQGG